MSEDAPEEGSATRDEVALAVSLTNTFLIIEILGALANRGLIDPKKIADSVTKTVAESQALSGNEAGRRLSQFLVDAVSKIPGRDNE